MYRTLTKTTLNKGFQRHVYQGLYNQINGQNIHMNRVAMKYNLPRLPVPTLQQTIDKYLLTVKPHLNDVEYEATANIVQKFSNGIGKKLQQLLIEKAESSENWLAEWWLNAAYLDFRYPVVVYSSPGLVYSSESFHNEEDRLNYSAKLISAALNYKLLIDGDKIDLEMMGKDPLDMNQYKKVFGTCRIPGLSRDSLEFHATSKHIVVVHNNHYFQVDVFGDDGNILSNTQIFEQLTDLMEQSALLTDPIGVLTTEHRDNWGKAYQHLINDPENKKSVVAIQKSLFLVCLDGPMPNCEHENRFNVAGQQFIHGGGSAGNAANRWYDKTIQFIIGQDGLVGLTYEHSPSEGQPIAVMTDYIINHIKDDKSKAAKNAAYTGSPRKLRFNVSKEIDKAIEKANDNVDRLAEDLDMDCISFKTFGKEFIKSQKLSPDSFIQVAMQYAFYRLHKIAGAHYESAATRKYIHGRTETIRSCSLESIAFSRAMLDENKTDVEKIKLLKQAIASHKKYTIDALNGFGVDRHLLGLKLMALEREMEISPLYSDQGYIKSAHMRISSSQVACKSNSFMCYGPLVADGYACCYNPRSDDILIAISAFNSHPDTKATNFKEAMVKSLLDMHNLLIKTQKSKL